MTDLNTVRENERWIGKIDCCVYNPRGRGGQRVKILSNLSPQILQMLWEHPGIVMSNNFDTNQVSVKSSTIEECGFLLNMTGNSGTLTYFKERKPKHHMNGLEDNCVWVVNVHGKSTNTKNFIYKTRKYF